MAANNPNDQDLSNMIETVAVLKDAFVSLGTTIKNDMLNNLNGTTAEMNSQRAIINDIETGLKRLARESDKLLAYQESLALGYSSSRDISKEMLKVKYNEQRVLAGLNAAHAKGLITQKELKKKTNEIRDATRETLDEYKKLYDVAKKREQAEKRLQTAMKGYMGVVGAMKRIPFFGSLVDASHVQERMTKSAEDYKAKTGKTAGVFRTLGVGIQATFEGIGKALLNPMNWLTSIVSLMGAVIKMVLEWEQTTYDIAKSVGVTVSQAWSLRSAFSGVTGAALVAKDVAESYGKLIDQIGFMGPVTNSFAGTAAKLEKRIAASADSMAGLAKAGAMTGLRLSDAYATAVGYAKVSGAKNKLALTERQIIGEVAKVSERVLVNFKGNLPALAEAVVRAKKLGLTLDEVAKRGDSLLDFETSLGAEFEAQVLTGKNLNLVKARELALAGKTGELMEELNRQGFSMNDWMSLNAIQQDGFAKAIGTTKEEYSKQLTLARQAEVLGAKEGESLAKRYGIIRDMGRSRESIAKAIGAEAEAELNKASTAERLEATITRIKERLSAMVAGPVLDLVNLGIKWLSNTENLRYVADGIIFIFKGAKSILEQLPKYANDFVKVLKVIAAYSIASAVANIAGSVGLTPFIGLPLAVAAGYTAYNMLSEYLPKFATGTGFAPGGPAIVGEFGREIVNIPRGSQVIPAQQTATMLKGGGGDSRPIEITTNLVVDGQVLATKVTKHMPKVPQKSLDGNTAVGGA